MYSNQTQVRKFNDDNNVSSEIRLKILESARLTGSSLNTQPWRFIVIQNKDNLLKLSNDSTQRKMDFAAVFDLKLVC